MVRFVRFGIRALTLSGSRYCFDFAVGPGAPGSLAHGKLYSSSKAVLAWNCRSRGILAVLSAAQGHFTGRRTTTVVASLRRSRWLVNFNDQTIQKNSVDPQKGSG
jgi:hypothetical protein